MKISTEWTSEERLKIVSHLLNMMSDDIYSDRYGVPGRPNVTSLQHVIHEPKEVLEANRASLEELLGHDFFNVASS